jgi:hypothetical protein
MEEHTCGDQPVYGGAGQLIVAGSEVLTVAFP